ncbi:hypothetical protein HG530_004928 [Fusarium avenaceum]|nr:hypothetical protein HG530_004928 [Fusarium avenaceum]
MRSGDGKHGDVVVVLAVEDVDGVPNDQDDQEASKSRLDSDENHTSNSLAVLRNGELVNKDKDQRHRQNANSLDGDTDDVARLSLKRSSPDEEAQKDGLNNELSDGLSHTVAIANSKGAALSKEIDNSRDEDPPVILLVRLVEQGVLDPNLFVVVQGVGIALSVLQLLDCAEDLPCEPAQNSCKDCERNTG